MNFAHGLVLGKAGPVLWPKHTLPIKASTTDAGKPSRSWRSARSLNGRRALSRNRRLQRSGLVGDRLLNDAEQFGGEDVGVDVAACVEPARPDRGHGELACPAEDLRRHRTITDGRFSAQQSS